MVKIVNNSIVLWGSALIGSLVLYYGMMHLLHVECIISTLEKFQVYFPITVTGYVCAKGSLFEKLDNICKSRRGIRTIILMMLIIIVFMEPSWLYRYNVNSLFFEMFRKCVRVISIPIFVYAIINITDMFSGSVIDKIIQNIGKYSMEMWFIHGIFFNCSKDIFQKILYLPYYPVIVLMWGLLICLIFSIPLKYFGLIVRKKI